ncbi:hypothetical protein nbrc107697_14710 [Gordonia crocea]|uniref:Uncharacterized protein n=1 Tax=Gordonia crocea TaxID=589162 RepID=A0A7I9UWX1_9ACTN|nr:hypothetical protein nbrc107697_14710 [Gordonia crocea]
MPRPLASERSSGSTMADRPLLAREVGASAAGADSASTGAETVTGAVVRSVSVTEVLSFPRGVVVREGG